MRQLMLLGLISLPFLTALAIFGWQGKGYPWWRSAVVIMGGGYLIPVIGTMIGWRLVRILQTTNPLVGFLVRGLVGVAILSGCFLTIIAGSYDINTAVQIFKSWKWIMAMLFLGFLYAASPKLLHRSKTP